MKWHIYHKIIYLKLQLKAFFIVHINKKMIIFPFLRWLIFLILSISVVDYDN